ncbi:unnamed protein product [Musa textilis]
MMLLVTVESQYPSAGIVKVMTYNVWFNEELELHERMKSIRHLILQHLPDVEVSQNIYDISQSSSHWKAYQCSVSSEVENIRYFCMLLTKSPGKRLVHLCSQLSDDLNIGTSATTSLGSKIRETSNVKSSASASSITEKAVSLSVVLEL